MGDRRHGLLSLTESEDGHPGCQEEKGPTQAHAVPSLCRQSTTGCQKQGSMFTTPGPSLETESWPSRPMPPGEQQASYRLLNMFPLPGLLLMMLGLEIPIRDLVRPVTNSSHVWGSSPEGPEEAGGQEPKCICSAVSNGHLHR